MPTYDYVCDACENAFEEFQSITAKPLRKCPDCGKPKLRRLIGTGAGIIFKGSGFYETDYRSKGHEKAAKADKESGDGGRSDPKPAGSDKAGDAKPAAKTEAKPAAAEGTKGGDKKAPGDAK